MKSLKTMLLILLIPLMLVNNSFALASKTSTEDELEFDEKALEDQLLQQYYDSVKNFVSIKYDDAIISEVNDTLYYEFLQSELPAKFVDPFYYMTIYDEDFGLEVIGLGIHESGWKVFKGPLNNNGTRDYGPLMLNSANIQNEKFMDLYSKNCLEFQDDLDTFYMCICMNFYKSIRNTYDEKRALMCYNGGYSSLSNTCTDEKKAIVTRYANIVMRRQNEVRQRYNEYKESRYMDLKNEITARYNEREISEQEIGILMYCGNGDFDDNGSVIPSFDEWKENEFENYHNNISLNPGYSEPYKCDEYVSDFILEEYVGSNTNPDDDIESYGSYVFYDLSKLK